MRVMTPHRPAAFGVGVGGLWLGGGSQYILWPHEHWRGEGVQSLAF